jgi:hypothetical protein
VNRIFRGKEMVLVDGENDKGFRNLLLIDPDQFRIPVPVFRALDPERSQRQDGP